MKMKIFAIYDSKAQAYLRPFYAPTKGLALRSVLAALQDPQHDLAKYPADFTLFELGEWDDSTGEFSQHLAKINLGVMLELTDYIGNTGPDTKSVEPLQKETEGDPSGPNGKTASKPTLAALIEEQTQRPN